MQTCANCGAPITFEGTTATCGFCQVVNQAPARPPKEVQVAVPVQVVHNVVTVISPNAAPTSLACPHCRRRLATVQVKDVALHGCGACGGIWVSNESARAMMAAPAGVYVDLASRCGQSATRKRAPRQAAPVCAECAAALDAVRSGALELDICPAHGTWFDAFELGQLVRSLLPQETKAAPAPSAETTCVGCQKRIARASANVTGRGAMCDGCWRTEQERQQQTSGDPGLFAAREGITGAGQFADPSVANRVTGATELASTGLGVVGALFDTRTYQQRR